MKEYDRCKVRLYPTTEQFELAISYGNGAKFAWNWALNEINEAYKNKEPTPSKYTLNNRFTQYKRKEGNEWLRKLSARSLKGAINRVSQAMVDFFNKIKGRPKFKKKRSNKMSFATHEGTFIIGRENIRCEKLGWIKCANHSIPTGKHVSYFNPVIIIDHGKMFFSVGIHYKPPIKPKNHSSLRTKNDVVGIDIGIKTPAIASNGMVCKKPNTNRLWKRISRLRRRASKQYKSMINKAIRTKTKFKYIDKSKNLQKLENRIYKCHQRISNITKSNIHNFTANIMKYNPKLIVLDKVNVEYVLKGISGRKNALDAAMGEIYRQLEYKAEYNDIPLIYAPQHYPSTQTCYNCGYVKSIKTNDKMTLKDRIYICPMCGYTEDRDLNASYNLKKYGMEYILGL